MSEPNETLNRSGNGVACEEADRSKSGARIRTQEARDNISKYVQGSLAPIVAKAITSVAAMMRRRQTTFRPLIDLGSGEGGKVAGAANGNFVPHR